MWGPAVAGVWKGEGEREFRKLAPRNAKNRELERHLANLEAENFLKKSLCPPIRGPKKFTLCFHPCVPTRVVRGRQLMATSMGGVRDYYTAQWSCRSGGRPPRRIFGLETPASDVLDTRLAIG